MKAASRGGRITHILRHTRMCRSNGLFFHKKSLNMGPISCKNILKHGFVFNKIFGFSANTQKIFKNGPIFEEKSLKMGIFSAKMTSKGYKT